MFGSICESEGYRLPAGLTIGASMVWVTPHTSTFPSADALRNPITVQKSHGPIVMITAKKWTDYLFKESLPKRIRNF
jgi:hypothetical protein